MSDTCEERNLKAALERVTKERDEALAILNDARMEQAWELRELKIFGARLLSLVYDEGYLGCCSSIYNDEGGVHSPSCEPAAILRDMLGPEEVQRQVDASHEQAIADAQYRERLRAEREAREKARVSQIQAPLEILSSRYAREGTMYLTNVSDLFKAHYSRQIDNLSYAAQPFLDPFQISSHPTVRASTPRGSELDTSSYDLWSGLRSEAALLNRFTTEKLPSTIAGRLEYVDKMVREKKITAQQAVKILDAGIKGEKK